MMPDTNVSGPPPVEMSGLDHWFGEGDSSRQVLFNIDLTLKPGELTILLGASGSGKTTLLTLMGCLRQVQSGNLRLLGVELYRAPESVLTVCRRQLGFIFQAHNLHDSLTAIQNVRMGMEVHSSVALTNWRADAAHVLGLLGLEDRLDYLPQQLSGGQKQRVAIASALVGNPVIVLSDEPTAALDKLSGFEVVSMLRTLGQLRGTTTLMVTHDNRILEMADRILTMQDGRLVGDTTGLKWSQ